MPECSVAMGRTTKAMILISMLPRRPYEVLDRIGNFLEAKLEPSVRARPYEISAMHSFSAEFAARLGPLDDSMIDGLGCVDLESEVSRRLAAVQGAPFEHRHNADFTLARVCYATCRAIRPEYVVETGVAYGVTSAFILEALEINGRGELHSIDLPPLASAADNYVGMLIPDRLRPRWHLHRGTSRRLLPRLLRDLRHVGVFVHDSLHTHSTMKRELAGVMPYLDHPAVVIADDIEGNEAFREFVKAARPFASAIIAEIDKVSLFGIAAFD